MASLKWSPLLATPILEEKTLITVLWTTSWTSSSVNTRRICQLTRELWEDWEQLLRELRELCHQVLKQGMFVFPMQGSYLPCRCSRRVLFLTRFCFLSSSSSSSGNTSFSHTSRHLILTKLGHSDQYLDHYSQTMVGSDVMMGSLGSKRSFSPKRHQVLRNT